MLPKSHNPKSVSHRDKLLAPPAGKKYKKSIDALQSVIQFCPIAFNSFDFFFGGGGGVRNTPDPPPPPPVLTYSTPVPVYRVIILGSY